MDQPEVRHSTYNGSTFPNFLLLESFLSLLLAHNFPVSVEDTLRMELMLRTIPIDTPSHQLKYLLSPIFVHNPAQQTLFYQLFDDFINSYNAPKLHRKLKRKPKKNNFYTIIAFVVLSIIAVLACVIYLNNKTQKEHANTEERIILPDEGLIKKKKPYQNLLLQKTISYKWVVACCIFCVTLAQTMLRRYYLPFARANTPPYNWELNIDIDPLTDSSNIHQIAQRLHTRQESEVSEFDPRKSIISTISGGGFPTIKFKFLTKRPEYVILINKSSTQDHLAAFYSVLVRQFQADGVHIITYFFVDDIRLCQEEKNGKFVHLEQITSRYSNSHQLIVITDIKSIVEPIVNTISKRNWSIIAKWNKRACFLTSSHEYLEETGVKSLFSLYQANLAGLQKFSDINLSFRAKAVKLNNSGIPSSIPYIGQSVSGHQVKRLHDYLGADIFLWLCMCAIYPDLQWKLTIFLGQLPLLPKTVLKEENILLLFSIPWFRQGQIPAHWRIELMRHLPEGILHEARLAIVKILSQVENIPPKGSYAEQTYLIEKSLQQWSAEPTPENRESLSLILSTLHPDDISDQTVLIHLLKSEKPKNQIQILSRIWQNIAYQHGIPEMGVRTSLLGIIAGAAAVFGAVIVSFVITGLSIWAHLSRNTKINSALTARVNIPHRVASVCAVIAISFVILVSRLAYIQIVRHQAYLLEAAQMRQQTMVLPASRGRVYDRSNRLLVFNEPAATIIVDPNLWGADLDMQESFEGRKDLAIKILQSALPEKPVKRLVNDRMQQAQVNDSGHLTYKTLDIARQISFDKGVHIKELIRKEGVFGIGVLPDSIRKSVDGDLASQIIGYTGIDGAGLAGVEYAYDSILTGSDGYVRGEFDRSAIPIPSAPFKRSEPKAGKDLILTIDSTLQQYVEDSLNKVFHESHATSAVVVVLDVKTGEVLAMANRPTYNNNTFNRSTTYGQINRCISEPFEPGAVLDVITMAAALEEKVASKRSYFYCNGSVNIDGHTINCTFHGRENIVDALTKSCNVTSANIALKLGKKRLGIYEKKFGFGAKTEVGLPGESRGIMHEASGWSEIQTANIGFGQGISVTPIQLAAAYNVIANGGNYVQPHIIRGFRDPSTEKIETPKIHTQRPVISSETAKDLLLMLQNVVENGNGKKASLSMWTSAGKTGVGQIAQDGKYVDKFNATFVGIAPVKHPEVVIAVVVTEPKGNHTGEQIAAPLFKEIAEASLIRKKVVNDKHLN